jgi:NAD(P)-dependent dehydrogenase (short-subunit alcohol dehydrogenase family)
VRSKRSAPPGPRPADHVAAEIATAGGEAVAAMAVMRPVGYGRIIMVASIGGLHGDVGLSAYAASKGGLLAFGRSLTAEGAAKGVLTNLLLPYALTQMTDEGCLPRRAGTWSRIWWRRCGDTNQAVADGLQRSGRIITCAALLIMIVFGGFAAGQTLGIKEMGLP